jgi:hypothetical protein
MAAVNFRNYEPAREMIYMTTFNFRFYLPREIRQLFIAGLDHEATRCFCITLLATPSHLACSAHPQPLAAYK